MLNYCPWRYAKCQTDQIDFFLSSHDGFSLKGPNQDTGSSEQQEQSVTLTQKLTSWYKMEAVEQPQGGWRIKEQTGKEYRVTEKQSELIGRR